MLTNIENTIGYHFAERNLLIQALTHSSYIKNPEERVLRNNERLEFLGDAILDAVVSQELYLRLPNVEEGKLTKIRARVVCENSLAKLARTLGLGQYLLLGPGENRTGGRDKDSILADTMEAVIGAVVLDGGYFAAEKFILTHFGEVLKDTMNQSFISDYKTLIQETLQSEGERDFQYQVVKEEGPDHAKIFYVELFLRDMVIGSGKGTSKKEAEQNAAKEALERRGNIVF
ncbi:MAG: ribonuclease III [Anaerovoracaceae bacterium]